MYLYLQSSHIFRKLSAFPIRVAYFGEFPRPHGILAICLKDDFYIPGVLNENKRTAHDCPLEYRSVFLEGRLEHCHLWLKLGFSYVVDQVADKWQSLRTRHLLEGATSVRITYMRACVSTQEIAQ